MLELLEVEGHKLAVGLNWKSAAKAEQVDKESWLEEWNASRGVEIKNNDRYSLGVAEGTIDDDSLAGKIHSLSAVCAMRYINSLFIMKFDFEGQTLYWGSIINKGVPELDYVSSNINELKTIINDKLNDQFNGFLNVNNPILASNIAIDDNELLEANILRETERLRDFNFQVFTYDDLDLHMDSIKGKPTLIKIIGTGGLTSSLREHIGFNKNTITMLICLCIFILVGLYISGAFQNKEEYDPFSQLDQSYELERYEEARRLNTEAELAVTRSLKDQLLGVGGKWITTQVGKWKTVPQYTNGFTKVSLVCDLSAARCETEYLPNFGYADFNGALSDLRSHFDDVVFTMNGEKLVGVTRILKSDLNVVGYLVDDLPVFDRGEKLIGPIRDLNGKREGMTAQLSNGEIVSVDMKKGYSGDVEHHYLILGWTISGNYLHQLEYAVNSIKQNFLAFNHMRIEQQQDGASRFNLSGSYLMQKDKKEK